MSYGPAYNRRKTFMRQTLGPKSVPNYYPLVTTETRSFIENILLDPSQYQRHLRKYAGGSILSVVYGYQVTSHTDQFLLVAEECMDLLANKIATGLGIWPVDMIPVLKYLPSWFPGTGFKRNAAVWKVKMQQFADGPYEHALANWVRASRSLRFPDLTWFVPFSKREPSCLPFVHPSLILGRLPRKHISI